MNKASPPEAEAPPARPNHPPDEEKISKAIERLLDGKGKECLRGMYILSHTEKLAKLWLSLPPSTKYDFKKLKEKVDEMIRLVEEKSKEKLAAFFRNDEGLDLAGTILNYYEAPEIDVPEVLAALADLAMSAKESPKE